MHARAVSESIDEISAFDHARYRRMRSAASYCRESAASRLARRVSASRERSCVSKNSERVGRTAVLWICLLSLAGCASFGPRLEAPTLQIADLEIVKGDLFEQRLRARVRVQNPNAQELRVRGITYSIELGGEELGRGLSGSSFVVPAQGEAEFDMTITANLAGTLLRLVERARKADGSPSELSYRLRGEVRLERGIVRTVPFERTGSLPLR